MALGLRTMEQRISAGNDFNGLLPTTELVRGDGIEAYPEDAQGGLFDFNLTSPTFVRSVELKLGGQSSWTVHKRYKDGEELLVMCGADDTDFLSTSEDSFVMTDKEQLVVRTTGAATAMVARVTVQAPV